MTECPGERFANRVDDYRRYRPSYPEELIAYLKSLVSPVNSPPVADIGAGTGIFSRLLLDAGYEVIGIEPNREMREAAEQDLCGYGGYRSIAGTAEATGLADCSVAMITAAQAFHWFDPAGARREFERILRPGGVVALIWNDRPKTGSAFLVEYEDMLNRFATDYDRVDHTVKGPEKMTVFADGGEVKETRFSNSQLLSREALHGRVASSSYTPAAGNPGHDELHRELNEMFDRHAVNGKIDLPYICRLFTIKPGGM